MMYSYHDPHWNTYLGMRGWYTMPADPWIEPNDDSTSAIGYPARPEQLASGYG